VLMFDDRIIEKIQNCDELFDVYEVIGTCTGTHELDTVMRMLVRRVYELGMRDQKLLLEGVST